MAAQHATQLWIALRVHLVVEILTDRLLFRFKEVLVWVYLYLSRLEPVLICSEKMAIFVIIHVIVIQDTDVTDQCLAHAVLQ